MKKLLLIIYTSLVLLFVGCSKVLDIPNLKGYDPSLVWSDLNVANAYLGNIYSSAFGNWNISLDKQSDQLTGVLYPADIVTTVNPGELVSTLGIAGNDWDSTYKRIRLINEGIFSANGSTLSESAKDLLLGQLYFLRAYTYFSLVRTYGGVPYIKVAQNREADELNIPRNSTKDCFDFMIKDIDSAIMLLPKHIITSSSDWGRIDGNFALAYKAKLLLYKASPQFNPGNPWNNGYWNEAYITNKSAYDSLKAQGYALVEDYSEIALSEQNTEIVFAVINQFPNKMAAWDHGARPGSLSRGPANATPTWEMVQAFPMKDGKLYNDPSGAYQKTDEQFLQNYWKDRDPRFEKSIVWNAKPYPVAGTVLGNRQYTSIGIADVLDSYGVNPKSSTKSQQNDRYSGFFILKNSDLTLTQAEVQQYDVDFVVMRFAEVMLNYAEAANETGHSEEALTILKEIRQRAGIEAGAAGNYGISATTREQIRKAIMDERNIEFCFEGLRFNDLRRWRMFSLLNGKKKHGVEAIAIDANGEEMPLSEADKKALNNELTEKDFKYSLLQTPQSGVSVNTIPDSYYFAPIQQSIIAAANNIEQNKDWGGTFNPTLE